MNQVRQADALIVAGARVMPTGELSTTLMHRVQTAHALLCQGVAPKIIVCGGRGGDEPTTEADAMKRAFIALGVPEQAILTDRLSTSTRENLLNARQLMRENGLARAVLVTSGYHLPRMKAIARDLGMDVTGAPAKGPDRMIMRAKALIREALSWIKYLVQKNSE